MTVIPLQNGVCDKSIRLACHRDHTIESQFLYNRFIADSAMQGFRTIGFNHCLANMNLNRNANFDWLLIINKLYLRGKIDYISERV